MSNQVRVFGTKFTTLNDKGNETSEVRFGFLIKDDYGENHVELYETATDLREDLKPKNILKTIDRSFSKGADYVEAIRASGGLFINNKWCDYAEIQN